MPGIFGVCKKNKSDQIGLELKKISEGFSDFSKREINLSSYLESSVGLGRSSLGIFNPVSQPVNHISGNYSIVFHGELYNNPGEVSDPEYVLNRYAKEKESCAVSLNGVFHFCVLDKEAGKLRLFSDKFGLQPLYYSQIYDGFCFAGEVRALLKADGVDKSPNFQSFADFLHYGQILGNKTLFKNIKLLGPGAVFDFDLKNQSGVEKKYWDLKSLFAEKGRYPHGVSMDEVVSLLRKSVQDRSGGNGKLGLSISGGLDSRGILAALEGRAEGVKSYTLGLHGCSDQKLADQMAEIAKTDHDFVELKKEYLKDFTGMANGMIRLSDGMYHPHESTEMLALEYFKKNSFNVLLRGHGGEIAKAALAYPVMVHKNVYDLANSDQIIDYIFNITNLVLRDNEPSHLFTSAFYSEVKYTPVESLRESCGEASQLLSPADTCIFYYIQEHIRRNVVSSLEIFRNQVEIRMPYVDEAYINLLLKLPVNQRNTGEVHFNLVKRCMPELVKVQNSNTGAPLDASPMRLFLLDKFNSVMLRLGVKGYRHYNKFQEWQRKEFKKQTEDILFSEKLAQRGLYNPEAVKNLFDAHISGKKNYAHLLGTMVGIELWYRNFVD